MIKIKNYLKIVDLVTNKNFLLQKAHLLSEDASELADIYKRLTEICNELDLLEAEPTITDDLENTASFTKNEQYITPYEMIDLIDVFENDEEIDSNVEDSRIREIFKKRNLCVIDDLFDEGGLNSYNVSNGAAFSVFMPSEFTKKELYSNDCHESIYWWFVADKYYVYFCICNYRKKTLRLFELNAEKEPTFLGYI